VGYSVAHIDDVQPGGPGDAVRFMRRELGVEAFGVNWFELPPGVEGYEHDETRSGQEEVAVVVKGSGKWRVGGETFLPGSARSCGSIPRRRGARSPAQTG
jgi:quercetin dioxygenase-like cupin family protein